MCFDRRGRFHKRRVFAGIGGIVTGALITSIFYSLFISEGSDPLDTPLAFPLVDAKSFQVHCYVATFANASATYLEDQFLAISETWGSRCSSLNFAEKQSETDHWAGWWEVLEKGEKRAKEGDWFVFSGLATYVVVDNLRRMVKEYAGGDTSSLAWATEFVSSPAASTPPFILSASALKRFQKFLKTDSRCVLRRRPIAHTLGLCLPAAGIHVADNRDERLRHRMLPYPIDQTIRFNPYLSPSSDLFYMKHKFKPGVDCCSPQLVSVSSLSTGSLHFYHYLLYKANRCN